MILVKQLFIDVIRSKLKIVENYLKLHLIGKAKTLFLKKSQRLRDIMELFFRVGLNVTIIMTVWHQVLNITLLIVLILTMAIIILSRTTLRLNQEHAMDQTL